MLAFSVFLGIDPAKIDLNQPFVLYYLLNTFKFGEKDGRFICSEMWAVITSMLKTALHDITKSQQEVMTRAQTPKTNLLGPDDAVKKHNRRRSLSLDTQLTMINLGESMKDPFPGCYSCLANLDIVNDPVDRPTIDAEKMINTIIHFIADMQQNSAPFKEFSATTTFLREVLDILFPIICNTDQLSAETELDLTVADDAEDRLRQGHSVSQTNVLQSAGNAVWSTVTDNSATRVIPFRRGSSFIIVNADGASSSSPSEARLTPAVNPNSIEVAKVRGVAPSNQMVSSLLDIVIAIFHTMLFERREFAGFGLATKVC